MMPQKAAKSYIGRGLKDRMMRKYIVKDEEDLIKQIEDDTELDTEWEKPVKGHVVEIKYASDKSTGAKSKKVKTATA